MADTMGTENMNFMEAPLGDAVLGVLEGPCADFVHGTRNGRKYSEELWNNVFHDPLIIEQIQNGGLPGELDHPADRTETDSTKIAILMSDIPKKKDGKLMARFKILNTPCGRIAFTLAKAGFHLGISSRGEGEVQNDPVSGEEIVKPDTYTLNAFDLVLLPSVKEARMKLITESLDTSAKRGEKYDYKRALRESLDTASSEDRKIMQETLDNLKINIDDTPSTTVGNAEVNEDLIHRFEESLKENGLLRQQVKDLQVKLSAGDAREMKLQESIDKLTAQNEAYKKAPKPSRGNSAELEEKLEKATAQRDALNEKVAKAKALVEKRDDKIRMLQDELNTQENLAESLDHASGEVKKLKEQLSRGKREYQAMKEQLSRASEELADAKQDLVIKNEDYNRKVKEVTEKYGGLTEKWKGTAKKAVDGYIGLRANMVGVRPEEIKKRLNKSFSFGDIEKVCEDLSRDIMTADSVPFGGKKVVKVQMKESKESPAHASSNDDDDIDEQLAYLTRKRL